MKKIMFVLMAGIMACAMTSCGGRCSTSECANDSIVADSADTIVAVDSIATDTLVNE